MSTQKWDLVPWSNQTNIKITIEIETTNITGMRPMFGPELYVPFTCTPDLASNSPIRLHSLEGWMVWNSEQAVLGGIRIPSQIIGPNQAKVIIPVTDEQIVAVEAKRTGDVVSFRVAFAGLATIPSPTKRLPSSGTTGSELLEVHQVYQYAGDGAEFLTIDLAHWIKILDGLQLGKRRLVELPEPYLPAGQDHWAECLRVLTVATQQYREHEFESVLANCRKVVEGCTAVLCSRWGVTRDQQKPFTVWSKDLQTHLASIWKIDPEDSVMFYALLNAAWKWTSSTHHYDSGIPYRDEVAFALSLVTDLIAFSAKVFVA